MASVTIDVDLPPGVKITSDDRFQDGHGFEVSWPLPERCRCEKCGHEERARIEFKTTPQAIRDLPVWDQPSFWIYQAPFHLSFRTSRTQFLRISGTAQPVSRPAFASFLADSSADR